MIEVEKVATTSVLYRAKFGRWVISTYGEGRFEIGRLRYDESRDAITITVEEWAGLREAVDEFIAATGE